MKSSDQSPARIQSRAPEETEGLIIRPFRFLKPISDQSVTKFATYRPPKLVKGKKRWWIEYYYRVPDELRNGKEWQKFRVFEDINRYKSQEYADALLKAIGDHLADGYNPFLYKRKHALESQGKAAQVTLNAALDRFIAQATAKGLRKKTVQSYSGHVELMRRYFINHLYQSPEKITKAEIKAFLQHARTISGWNNNTYNNNLTTVKTVFNWMVKEDMLIKNPAIGIDMLPVNISRNTYYDEKTAKAIKKAMNGRYISQFCEFIYYTGIRPKSEARLLKVENILLDRKLIYVPGEVSKNRTGDYVPMCDELFTLLRGMNLDKYPGHYYLWSISEHPAERPASSNHFASLYKPYKDKLKLGAEYSIYSWKHSRAIDLANAGANPYEIMKLFRHSSLEQTLIYLRGLGCNISDEVNKKTKKF